MLNYDPVSTLRHYPIAMSRFGLNPHGECLYRIVFAPSRRYLVVGQWPDGSECAHWIVKHKNVGDSWIMEKWITAEEFHPPGKEDWDANMLSLGPWPSRGEYELCHVFPPHATPVDSNIEKLISWIEAGKGITLQENMNYHRQQDEAERDANRKLAEDLIRNRLPAFGSRPFAARGGTRGTKTAKILKTAEELGLPTAPGPYTKPNPPQLAA
jgi:hypothetical protein